jgi:hypothetical protein
MIVETFGYGRVELTTFSTFWLLVSSVECHLCVKLKDTVERIIIKLGALEHDGLPNGYVVWMTETALSRTELRSLWSEFSKKDEQNALMHCDLSESLRDSAQCNAIIGLYWTIRLCD